MCCTNPCSLLGWTDSLALGGGQEGELSTATGGEDHPVGGARCGSRDPRTRDVVALTSLSLPLCDLVTRRVCRRAPLANVSRL